LLGAKGGEYVIVFIFFVIFKFFSSLKIAEFNPERRGK